jgi:hypothetical protein
MEEEIQDDILKAISDNNLFNYYPEKSSLLFS